MDGYVYVDCADVCTYMETERITKTKHTLVIFMIIFI
jgi:hypothetical protein